MKVAKSYFRDILGSLLYSPQCSLLETIHTKKKRIKEINRLALGKFCQFSKKKKIHISSNAWDNSNSNSYDDDDQRPITCLE